ncbi:MAG: GatB/YqeY domain-containing protein [Chloroflexi bacterium]|nr:GatB/YqeY domain-containing protein [Anaerolineae bacterium]RLC74123.1 MAG: GatB/YqeY domain-containing protein [Chloroflexota bacterium]
MSLKQKLQDDLKQAIRDGDSNRKSTIRLALTAITNAEVQKRRELDEAETLAILSREAKQRRESVEEYRKAGRVDLVAQEEAELQILLSYMPAQMSRDEIVDRAREVIAEVGATSPAQMGAVMRRLMPALRGRADGRVVSEIVRDLLSG